MSRKGVIVWVWVSYKKRKVKVTVMITVFQEGLGQKSPNSQVQIPTQDSNVEEDSKISIKWSVMSLRHGR